MAQQLDAVVLADDPLAQTRIAGLKAHERALRVATKLGATRVLVLDGSIARPTLIAWRTSQLRPCPLLVIRADQLVHTPLVAPLVAACPDSGVVCAVGADGSDGGAWLASGSAADAVVAAVVGGANEPPADATPIEHGDIARHAIGTKAERTAAQRMLYRILIKPQDNAITRYLYRPISFPLTRLLVWTPITPNQISALVAILVAIGCWLTMHASYNYVLAGTVTILASSYLDCCDGEIARVKLLSSRFGAWIDTVIDELSSVAYIVALGYHCHLHYGAAYLGRDIWMPVAIAAAMVCLWAMFCIYYNIIVAVGSANSQDYVGRFEVVPGTTPSSMRLRPATAKVVAPPRPQWMTTVGTLALYIVRRDFISWLTVLLAVLHLTQLSFAILAIGCVPMTIVLTIDHVKLRQLRASIMRQGLEIER